MDVATIGAVWEFKAYGGGGTSKFICQLPFLRRRPVLPSFGATLSVQNDPRQYGHLLDQENVSV